MGLFFGFKSINPKIASTLLTQGNTILVDVRTDGEYQSGHVSGAIHIPLHMLSGHVAKIAQDHKDKNVLVICHTGSRSASACVSLAKKGLKVYNVTGGMMAWNLMGDKALLAK